MPLRLLGALVILLFLGTPAFADAAKYCVPDAANIVVYVDRTTPYDPTDKTDLVDGVSRLFENLKGGERFTIRTIADSFTASASLLDQCVPFCPDQGPLGDLFGSCTEGVMLNDRKHLRQGVVRQLQSLLANFTELPNSEIVRTIGLSAPGEMRADRTNRFYLFTDLIENSLYLPGKRFFSDKNDLLLKQIATDGLIPDLTGAQIQIFGVGRGGNPGDRHPLDQALLSKLTDFWQRYFAVAKATVTIQQALGAVD